MRVITVQTKEVVEQLDKNGEYYVSPDAPVPVNLIDPYKFMMKYYGYSHRPIFMCPVGYKANFGGADTNNTYIIEMEIPDKFCNIQDYYGWSDFAYFTELPNDYEEFYGFKTVEEFGRYVLGMYKDGFIGDRDTVYQVTTQVLHKSWVKKIVLMTDDFCDKYSNTGGVYILESLC